MKHMTLGKIAEACGGIYHGEDALRNAVVQSITTDSRKAEEGCLFVAIPGAKADGHRFIPDVYRKGALAVLSERKLEDPAGPYIEVTSSLEAVQGIAAYYREQLDLKVVGITGSVGKTSTKEVIASVLSQKYNTLKTLGNFNNELGVPLTIFRLREEHEAAVLEMGINHFGEMHRLSRMVQPDICVITNIGQCHLEFLGDRDGVLRAKSEIFDFMAQDGRIILNGDDDKLAQIEQARGIRPVFFGIESGRDIYADHIENCGLKGIRCTIHVKNESVEVMIPIPGYHMVKNALAAAAVGTELGLTLQEIKAGIEKLEALSGRFHIIEKEKIVIIDDCYNANPVSVKASLDVLKNAEGRKTAILGDMGELGADEVRMHREVGAYAARSGVDRLICVGERSRHMAQAAKEAGGAGSVAHMPSAEDLLACLPDQIEEGDTVLVKASHFMQFEKIVEKLEEIYT